MEHDFKPKFIVEVRPAEYMMILDNQKLVYLVVRNDSVEVFNPLGDHITELNLRKLIVIKNSKPKANLFSFGKDAHVNDIRLLCFNSKRVFELVYDPQDNEALSYEVLELTKFNSGPVSLVDLVLVHLEHEEVNSHLLFLSTHNTLWQLYYESKYENKKGKYILEASYAKEYSTASHLKLDSAYQNNMSSFLNFQAFDRGVEKEEDYVISWSNDRNIVLFRFNNKSIKEYGEKTHEKYKANIRVELFKKEFDAFNVSVKELKSSDTLRITYVTKYHLVCLFDYSIVILSQISQIAIFKFKFDNRCKDLYLFKSDPGSTDFECIFGSDLNVWLLRLKNEHTDVWRDYLEILKHTDAVKHNKLYKNTAVNRFIYMENSKLNFGKALEALRVYALSIEQIEKWFKDGEGETDWLAEIEDSLKHHLSYLDYKQYSLEELNVGVDLAIQRETLPEVFVSILKVLVNELLCEKVTKFHHEQFNLELKKNTVSGYFYYLCVSILVRWDKSNGRLSKWVAAKFKQAYMLHVRESWFNMDYFRRLAGQFNLVDDLNAVAQIRRDFIVFQTNLKTGNLSKLIDIVKTDPEYYSKYIDKYSLSMIVNYPSSYLDFLNGTISGKKASSAVFTSKVFAALYKYYYFYLNKSFEDRLSIGFKKAQTRAKLMLNIVLVVIGEVKSKKIDELQYFGLSAELALNVGEEHFIDVMHKLNTHDLKLDLRLLQDWSVKREFKLALVEVYKLQRNYLKALQILLTFPIPDWRNAFDLFAGSCSSDSFCLNYVVDKYLAYLKSFPSIADFLETKQELHAHFKRTIPSLVYINRFSDTIPLNSINQEISYCISEYSQKCNSLRSKMEYVEHELKNLTAKTSNPNFSHQVRGKYSEFYCYECGNPTLDLKGVVWPCKHSLHGECMAFYIWRQRFAKDFTLYDGERKLMELVEGLHAILLLKTKHGPSKLAQAELQKLDLEVDELCGILVDDCPICGTIIFNSDEMDFSNMGIFDTNIEKELKNIANME